MVTRRPHISSVNTEPLICFSHAEVKTVNPVERDLFDFVLTKKAHRSRFVRSVPSHLISRMVIPSRSMLHLADGSTRSKLVTIFNRARRPRTLMSGVPHSFCRNYQSHFYTIPPSILRAICPITFEDEFVTKAFT